MDNRLALWGYNFEYEITRIDFGTVASRSSGDTQLRVKNLSTVYTATAATLSVEGADAAQYLLSADGTAFTATLSLGDLPAATATGTLWLRRTTASDATQAPVIASLRAHAAGWDSPA